MKKFTISMFSLLVCISAIAKPLPNNVANKKDTTNNSSLIDTIYAKTIDGKPVILYSNGKWCFAENDSLSQDVVTDTYKIPAKRIFRHPPFSTDRSAPYQFTKEFDRFKNFTSTRISLKMSVPSDNMDFSAFYIYEGTTPSVPTKVMISFMSKSDDWKYLRSSNLNMLLDGKPKDFGKMKRDGTVGRGYVLEHMNLLMPIEDFLEIINANRVEIRIFITEMAFSEQQLEALREFASEMK